jgi:hypothetical protein
MLPPTPAHAGMASQASKIDIRKKAVRRLAGALWDRRPARTGWNDRVGCILPALIPFIWFFA